MAGGLSFRKKKRLSQEVKQTIRTYILGCIASAGFGILLIVGFGYTLTNVGVSMTDEIAHNQKVLLNRTSYLLFSPKAGDVVVFQKGTNAHLYIKRVVAVPGDTVQIIDSELYVNNVRVKDNYDKMVDSGIAKEKIVLGEDEFFVLGDNRNNSEDSRSETIGVVNKSEILGKAWLALPSQSGSMKIIE